MRPAHPYRVGDRLLLDVQQVIPLPEASELTIQLQRKATQERAIRGTDGRDWTQYVITVQPARAAAPQEASHPDHGHHAASRRRASQRDRQGDPAFAVPFRRRHARRSGTEGGIRPHLPEGRPRPLLHGDPVHDEGRTWIVTKMWGRNTEPILERLTKLAPEQSGIGYEAVPRLRHGSGHVRRPVSERVL